MIPYYSDNLVTLYHGDCLEIMPNLEVTFDACITDPPYGTTACKWDSVIPFEQMWESLKILVKKNGAICLFGSEPFSSALRMSNIKEFKYDWIWVKNTQTGMMSSGKIPMKKHEIISVFYASGVTFNERLVLGSLISQNHAQKGYSYKNKRSSIYDVSGGKCFKWSKFIHANTILTFNVVGNRDKEKFHSTQKPVALIEYLIKTYTNEGEIVLDFASGSGTTGIACKNTGRRCVLIEKEESYCELSAKRLEKNTTQPELF